jgi:hypothetical protein
MATIIQQVRHSRERVDDELFMPAIGINARLPLFSIFDCQFSLHINARLPTSAFTVHRYSRTSYRDNKVSLEPLIGTDWGL